MNVPMLLADVRKVTLYFIDSEPVSRLIPAADIDSFVLASKRLHWNPGRNPHSGVECAKIWQITVAELKIGGPYWWTTPGLGENNNPAGARIIDGGIERTVFVDDEYVARCKAEQAEAEAANWRERERKARAEAASEG